MSQCGGAASRLADWVLPEWTTVGSLRFGWLTHAPIPAYASSCDFATLYSRARARRRNSIARRCWRDAHRRLTRDRRYPGKEGGTNLIERCIHQRPDDIDLLPKLAGRMATMVVHRFSQTAGAYLDEKPILDGKVDQQYESLARQSYSCTIARWVARRAGSPCLGQKPRYPRVPELEGVGTAAGQRREERGLLRLRCDTGVREAADDSGNRKLSSSARPP